MSSEAISSIAGTLYCLRDFLTHVNQGKWIFSPFFLAIAKSARKLHWHINPLQEFTYWQNVLNLNVKALYVPYKNTRTYSTRIKRKWR